MNQRILAATDLSAPSRHAVDRAFRLAAERGWPLSLVHAFTPGLYDELQAMLGLGAPSLADTLAREAAERLNRLNGNPVRTRGVLAECAVVRGSPVTAVVDYAAQIEAGLLVLGARGEGFLHQMAFGSTASRILRKSRQPVLVVKQPPHEGYSRLLVAIDFSPASLATLRLARRVAPEAAVVLLHAVVLPFEGKMQYANVSDEIILRYRTGSRAEGLRRLEDLASAESLPAGSTRLLAVHADSAPQLILEQEQEHDCDLIVVGKHGVNVVEELLLGSTTKHLLGESQGDILISV